MTLRIVLPLACALVAAACGAEPTQQAGGGPAGPGQGAAPEVGYIVAQPVTVPRTIELSGRTAAFQTSEVRPQVSGIIQERLFAEGAMVEAGETLYRIDPSLYQAALNEASANLESARANAEAARARADRYRPLAAAQAVSQQDYADAEAQARQAEAAVEQARARLSTAQINLRHTEVTAPISGRIGRSLYTVGALVTSNQSDPLAVIQGMETMFVDIQQSSAALLTLRRSLGAGGFASNQAEVRLRLEDGGDYDYPGVVEFAEAMVNASTGTVTLRASFPNPDGLLLPGMFVRAVFNQGEDVDAFLAPQVGLSRDAQGQAFVWLVGPDDIAVRQTVSADRVVGDNWVITEGLRPGDRMIVEGTGRLMADNQPVRAMPAGPPPPPVDETAGEAVAEGAPGVQATLGGG